MEVEITLDRQGNVFRLLGVDSRCLASPNLLYTTVGTTTNMLSARGFSRILLLILCAVAFNQGLITYVVRAGAVSRLSVSTALSECLRPGPADFATQQITPSTSNASLPGHVVQPVSQSQAHLIGSLNPTIQLRVELVFKIRNEAQFQNCLASINDPSSPEYQHYLNRTTLQPFLPTPGQKVSVSDLLTQEGLSVTDGASPLVLNIKGTAQAIMSAFAVRLSAYSYGNSTFFATASDPQMPSNLAPLINGILGLENYTRAMPAESPCTGPYCPQGVQIGYSISPLISNGDIGSGQSVAVVDMPGDPNSQAAINKFDSKYGLPATNLDIIYPDGTPTSWNSGWAGEAAMDIEAVHSVGPGATIVLAYDTVDPMNGIDNVTSRGLASVISNSWTYDCGYSCSDTQLPSSFVSSYDSRLAIDAAQGVTIVFATGDEGAKPDGVNLGTEFPASDPNVLAIGATNLELTGCGVATCTGYGSESGASISGGGYSGYFSEPSWQISTIGSTASECTAGHLNPTCRGVPDVSMFGLNPFFWVYSTVGGWGAYAGTSLSTPLWAGFIGVALQVKGGGHFGIIAPLLYQLGAGSSYSTLFHDVTAGSNNGYSAGPGWDPVTGWGSPIANNLAYALNPTPQTLVTQVDSGSGSFNPNCLGGCPEASGSVITVTATPTQGWFFSNWSTQTGVSCSANPCTFNMPSKTVTLGATFTQVTQALTTSVASATGSGSVAPKCPSGCSEPLGSGISVAATAGSNYVFSGWTIIGASCSGGSTSNPCTFTMPNNAVTVSATFTQIIVTMSVSYSVAGGGTPTAPVLHYVLNGVSKKLTLKTVVTKVKADGGSSWSVTPNTGPLTGSTSTERWDSNQALSGSASTTTIIFVYYHQTLQTLSYTLKGGGTPTAPNFQSSQFGSSASVQLTTTPTGSWFDVGMAWTVTNPLGGSTPHQERWFTSQAASGVIGTTTSTAFTYNHQFFLTMSSSGPGSVMPKSGWHNAGSKVTIKATANTGHVFTSWTGTFTITTATATVTMNSAITETAKFS